MRNFALFSHHSAGNAELAELTLLNHWRYSLRWGYDFIVYREPWPGARAWVMDGGEADVVRSHAAVAAVGSDVVFTNFDRPIHELADPAYGLVVTTEHWTPGAGCNNYLNCGVAIYHNNAKFDWYLAQLRANREQYLAHPWYHQQLMVDLLALNGLRPVTTPLAKEAIKVIPARAMNSAVHPNAAEEGRWQPGDLAAHCYAIPEGQAKIETARKYLALVNSGGWKGGEV